MSAWPPNPAVLEIDTYVWLQDLRRRYGRALTLADVPAEVWDDVARPGIDAVWLMGVWERSPRGAQIARTHPAMRGAAERALDHLADVDVVGSAYCVRRYTADPFFGGDLGLAMARVALAHRDVKLVLDFVPNHTAPDHPWALQRPEYYVHGTFEEVRDDPASCIEVNGHMLACGRDPHAPAWPDVVQLDASNPDLRAVVAEQVLRIAERCDAVRCDMAMLVLDDVFEATWGARGVASRTDGRGFWPTVIEPVKAAHPDFQFWAEAYWGREPDLLAQGFDAGYDKPLHDLLLQGPSSELRVRIGDAGAAPASIRFVEHHDEVPAATVVGPARHRALLAAVATLPGVALLHDGGLRGRRAHVPVILGRRPAEEPDPELTTLVDGLFAVLGHGLRRGEWQPVGIEGWPDNRTYEQLLAWTWTLPDRRVLVVVHLGEGRADGMVAAPWDDLTDEVVLVDRLTGERLVRSGTEWTEHGLYVALDAGGVHVFELAP